MNEAAGKEEIGSETQLSMESVNKLIKKGYRFYAEDETDKAIQYFDKALKSDPTSSSALFGKGIILENSENPEKAIELLEKAWALDPTNSGIPYSIGVYYFIWEKAEKAIEYYEKAIELDPGFSNAWLDIGIAYGTLKRPEKAMPYFIKALELSGENAKIYYSIGLAYELMDQCRDAVDYLKKAVELEPDDFKMNNRLAIVYSRINDSENSVKYMEKAFALRPDNIEVKTSLAKLYLYAHHLDKAIIQFKELSNITPDSVEINFYLGYSLSRMKRYKEAIPLLEKVLEEDTLDFRALINLADAYNNTYRFEDAIEIAKIAMQSYPGAWQPYVLIAMGYTGLRKFDRALKWIEKGLKKGDDKSEVYYHKAMIHYKRYFDPIDMGIDVPEEEFGEDLDKVLESLKKAAQENEQMFKIVKNGNMREFIRITNTPLFKEFVANL